MKKIRSSFILLLSLCLVFSAAVPAHAKDLEVCYHCSGSGEYHCSVCGDSGQVSCDQCGGKGTQACPGEDGKGACSSGWYTCPSCHGDTYLRNGDGQIPQDAAPGSCSTCSGKGKLECIVCHGSGRKTCNRCGGSGKQECQVLDCRTARSAGGKCSYCMGAGYLLTNNEPGKNDGVQNKPENGDLIWANGKSTTYGGGNSGGSGNSENYTNSDGNSNQGGSGGGGSGNSGGSGGSNNTRYDNNGSSIPRDPSSGRDFIWYLDTGSGKWEFGDVLISIERGGKAVSGTLDLKFNENITIKSSTGDLGRVHAYITGSEGFKAELERNGDGDISVARHMPEGQYVPFKLSLMIEYEQDDPANDPAEPGPEVDPPEPGPGEDPADIPDERPKYPVDFGSGSWIIDGAEKPVRALIDGHAASGVVEVEEYTAIKLADFDGGFMQARIYSDDGFSAALETNGDNEVSLGRLAAGDANIPDAPLRFEVLIAGDEGQQGEEEQYKYTLIFSTLQRVEYRHNTTNKIVNSSALDYLTYLFRVYTPDEDEHRLGEFNENNYKQIGKNSSFKRNAYQVNEDTKLTITTAHSLDKAYWKVMIYSPNGYQAELRYTSRTSMEMVEDKQHSIWEFDLAHRSPRSEELPSELYLMIIPTYQDPEAPDDPSKGYAPTILKKLAKPDISVNTDKLTKSQINKMKKLSEKEAEQLLEQAMKIVSTVKIGDEAKYIWWRSDPVVQELMKKNNIKYDNNPLSTDLAFVPISYTGHMTLPFPIEVTVNFKKGQCYVSPVSVVYAYHVTEKGNIENLGRTEITTYEDGTVKTMTFWTSSFSDFFASIYNFTEGVTTQPETYQSEYLPYIIIGAALFLAAAAVAAVIIMKRRKKV